MLISREMYVNGFKCLNFRFRISNRVFNLCPTHVDEKSKLDKLKWNHKNTISIPYSKLSNTTLGFIIDGVELFHAKIDLSDKMPYKADGLIYKIRLYRHINRDFFCDARDAKDRVYSYDLKVDMEVEVVKSMGKKYIHISKVKIQVSKRFIGSLIRKYLIERTTLDFHKWFKQQCLDQS